MFFGMIVMTLINVGLLINVPEFVPMSVTEVIEPPNIVVVLLCWDRHVLLADLLVSLLKLWWR